MDKEKILDGNILKLVLKGSSSGGEMSSPLIPWHQRMLHSCRAVLTLQQSSTSSAHSRKSVKMRNVLFNMYLP